MVKIDMEPTKNNILAYLSSHKEMFRNEFQVSRLGLFGSFATGQATEGSDIDVLIEFEPQTSNLSEKKAKIRSLIAATFNRKVDLCREKYMKPYFKSYILKSTIYV